LDAIANLTDLSSLHNHMICSWSCPCDPYLGFLWPYSTVCCRKQQNIFLILHPCLIQCLLIPKTFITHWYQITSWILCYNIEGTYQHKVPYYTSYILFALSFYSSCITNETL